MGLEKQAQFCLVRPMLELKFPGEAMAAEFPPVHEPWLTRKNFPGISFTSDDGVYVLCAAGLSWLHPATIFLFQELDYCLLLGAGTQQLLTGTLVIYHRTRAGLEMVPSTYPTNFISYWGYLRLKHRSNHKDPRKSCGHSPESHLY